MKIIIHCFIYFLFFCGGGGGGGGIFGAHGPPRPLWLCFQQPLMMWLFGATYSSITYNKLFLFTLLNFFIFNKKYEEKKKTKKLKKTMNVYLWPYLSIN